MSLSGGDKLPEPLISARGLCKTYQPGNQPVHALRDVNFDIAPGEYVAVIGPSGSGKSTLMNLLGALDRPTSGLLFISGAEVGTLEPDELAELRNETIGFVFQLFNLLPRTTALDNVQLPLLYSRRKTIDPRAAALVQLEAVGLSDRTHHLPSELSGGQQQRVAIARALVSSPKLILADEPTGSLDTHTSGEIMDLFETLNAGGLTIIVVTHDPEVASRARRRIVFRDGMLVKDESGSRSRSRPRRKAKR